MKDHSFDLLDALNAPLLTFCASWSDCISKRIKDIVPTARLKALYNREEMATYPEIVCYLTTRAFVAPMDREYTDIYTHVCCKVLKEWFNEDHFKQIQAPEQLSLYLQSQLDSLRLTIYHKRRERLKEKIKKSKNENSN